MTGLRGIVSAITILAVGMGPDAQWDKDGNKLHTTGRVGIGIDDPSQKLDIDGNINVTGWIGTNADGPVTLRSNKMRVFEARWAQSEHTISPNLIGGHESNTAAEGVAGGTIAGGGRDGAPNTVTKPFSTVSGGEKNTASGICSTVGGGTANTASGSISTTAGGQSNTASGENSFIGGGASNKASGQGSTVAAGGNNAASSSYASIGGGAENTASGNCSTIAGGQTNVASGPFSVVPGGVNNSATGKYSLAAGQHAVAGHDGAFAWGDSSTNVDLKSSAANQFIVRAAGGIWLGKTNEVAIPAGRFINTSTGAHLTTGGAWTNNSDRAAKRDLTEVDNTRILDRVCALPITNWRYNAESPDVRHIGPMAQDFAAAFQLGGDDKSISTIDADGVALASIQALRQLITKQDEALQDKQQRIEALEISVQSQQDLIRQLMTRMSELEARLGTAKN